MLWLGPAFTVGCVVFTDTVTVPVPVHPLLALVTVKVYVVVLAGEAIGLAMLLALKPVDGDQAYVNPAVGLFPSNTPPVLLTQVIVALWPALACGAALLTLITT